MLRLLTLFFCVSLFHPVFAAERVDIYSASVQVDSQLEDDRKAAFTEGLKQVFVKITGDSTYLENPELEPVLNDAARYVAGFSYQRNPWFGRQSVEGSPAKGEEAAGVHSMPEKAYVLRVQYEESAVLQNLRGLGMPVWGALRPTVLAWVVMQREGERYLVNSDHPELVSSLSRESDRFGIPVFLPVGDLEDLSAVNLNDLWGLFPSAVTEASKRYPSDFKLLARVYEAEEGLELKWSLLLGGQVQTERAKSVDYHSLWRQMNESVAKELSKRFAVTSDPNQDGQELIVVVSGIEQFVDYARMAEHLDSLSSVEAASVLQVEQDTVRFSIRLRGSRSSFEQQVALAGKLKMVMPEFGVEDVSGGVDDVMPLPDESQVGGSEAEDRLVAPVDAYFYWVSSGGE